MMNHNDTIEQIPDYVLGILPENRIGEIERHVLSCKTCQQLVAGERSMGRAVRGALEAAARPDPSRLQLLMPPIPRRPSSSSAYRVLRKQLQPAFIVLLLILGGLLINGMFTTNDLPTLVVTTHAATATSTNTPTATLVYSSREAQNIQDRDVNLGDSDRPTLPSTLPLLGTGPIETPDAVPTPAITNRQAVQ